MMVPGFTLLLFRISGMVASAPGLSQSQLPWLWKAGLAVGLTALLWPLCPTSQPGAAVWLAVHELALGYCLGWLATAALQTVAAAGSLLDLQTGLSNATLLDPVRGESQPVWSTLYHSLALLVFFQAGGLSLLLRALLSSLHTWPLGQASQLPVEQLAIKFGSWFFVATTGLALPLLLSLWGLDLLLAMLSRSLPQLNLLQAAPPLKQLLAWWLTLLCFQSLLEAIARVMHV